MTDFTKPLSFSKQLPYAEKIEDEAKEMWTTLKTNLTCAIKRQELWPGALYWSLRLQR